MRGRIQPCPARIHCAPPPRSSSLLKFELPLSFACVGVGWCLVGVLRLLVWCWPAWCRATPLVSSSIVYRPAAFAPVGGSLAGRWRPWMRPALHVGCSRGRSGRPPLSCCQSGWTLVRQVVELHGFAVAAMDAASSHPGGPWLGAGRLSFLMGFHSRWCSYGSCSSAPSCVSARRCPATSPVTHRCRGASCPRVTFRLCPTAQVVLRHCVVSEARRPRLRRRYSVLVGSARRCPSTLPATHRCRGAISALRVLSNVPHDTGGVAALCSLGA